MLHSKGRGLSGCFFWGVLLHGMFRGLPFSFLGFLTFFQAEVIFTPHFLIIVVEEETLGLPCIINRGWREQRSLHVKYFHSIKCSFVSAIFHRDPNDVTKM